ncbi:MAG: ATP-binding protein [Bacteroidota bacterium]
MGIALICLGIEFFLFEVTDYTVYRVLDISARDILLLFFVFSLQFAFFKWVPTGFDALWKVVKTDRVPALLSTAIALLAGSILYHFLSFRQPVWFFLLLVAGLGGFSYLIHRITDKFFHKTISVLLLCAGFNASFVFWVHEETNKNKHIQYAQQLAERRDTLAENELVRLLAGVERHSIDEKDKDFWEKKWLNNPYLSSNYRLQIDTSTTDTTQSYHRPVLTFDENDTPVYKLYLSTNYSLSFKLRKDFRSSVYTAHYPYKEMERLNDYHFSVVDHGRVVLANSHDFDLNILDIPLPPVGTGAKIELNGFDVLAYHHSEDQFVLIGEPLSEVLVWVSNFSFFFSLFILAALLVQLLELLLFRKDLYIRWRKLSIDFRIQATLLSLTILLFFIIAITTLFFLRQNNREITYERQFYIAEAIRKAIVEDKVLFDWELTDFSIDRLSDLADRNKCDIDLYNARGALLLSSIATAGNSPAPTKVDQRVQEDIQKNPTAVIINTIEQNGASCLRSVFSISQDNRIEGFAAINVFASEVGTAQDIPIIMSKILSVYVFLLLIIWGIGLSIIGFLTKPLRLLANRLSQFKPGKINEKLDWEGEDAIGQLIGEYNKMVDVVEQTTKSLMQAERQGAWQIMAQQIAHEVNNPLTPLRLNVQYFTHILKQQQTPSPETVKRISDSLVEQVDHLSRVASQFKLFANMEAPETKPLELRKFMAQFILPYKSRQDYQFEFINNIDSDFDPTINIDSEHFRQVLTNLMTNAEHAIPEDQKGVILLHLKRQQDKIVLELEDNGKGMDAKTENNLFDPQFSTNSSLSGLGLPICQRIIEFYGGDLSFTTKLGLGTCFRIAFSIA